MVFWRAKKAPVGADEHSPANDTAPVHAVSVSTLAEQKPPAVDLSPEADAAATSLDFATTNDLEPFTGWLGQDQAVKFLQTVFAPDRAPCKVWIIAEPELGIREPLIKVLAKLAKALPPSPDWAVIQRLDGSQSLIGLALPPGQGARLSKEVARSVSELTFTLPAEFASAGYAMRERAILESVDAERASALDEFRVKAEAQNVALLRTAAGYALAPLHDGRVVKPVLFDQLPKIMRDDVETRISQLDRELAAILQQQPDARRAEYLELLALRQEHAKPLVAAAFRQTLDAFSGLSTVQDAVRAMIAHVIENLDLLTSVPQRGPEAVRADPVLRSFVPRQIATSGEGRVVEWTARDDARSATELLMQANGGILLVDEADFDASPEQGRVLMQTLRSRTLTAEQFPAIAMPWTGRAVLVSSKARYQALLSEHPTLASQFYAPIHCVATLPSTAANDVLYASWLAAVVKHSSLLPLSSSAVGVLVEDSAKRAPAKHELSLKTAHVRSVLQLADVSARLDKASRIETAHIEAALVECAPPTADPS